MTAFGIGSIEMNYFIVYLRLFAFWKQYDLYQFNHWMVFSKDRKPKRKRLFC